ncbi:VENN motif pre-toxin domain-containing protein, partial [Photorhabdus luminescens]|uniref:VENN motif pre-toxin domain-containing protein n=1 Tax=Photorhabdus luminescens TaxID=29488 RepID=UPI00272F5864
GAVAAEVSGNNALAGAAGAAGGELAARELMKHIHGENVKVSDLSEEEKQTISTLSTLAAGLAGGIAGDSTGSAVTGAQAGKNAVENNSLLGDNARKSVKESTEYWKTQIRDKMGENLASQLTNGVLNAVSEASDFVMAGGDTVLDAAMALTSCATGDNYCNRAISDLSKKDQAAGKALNSLVNGETWNAIKDTATKASQGDQVALENLAGVLTSVIVPVKGLPTGGKTGAISEQDIAKGTVGSAEKSPTVSKRDNWSAGEGQYSPETQGTVTNIEHANGKFDGKSLPYAEKELKPTSSNGTDALAAKAQQELLNEINKFKSKNQAGKYATMVAAYDPVTGKTAVGRSNGKITAEALHPKTVEYVEKQLGVKIGEFTSFCKNSAGACAEVSSADQLIRQGVEPSRIKFTEAVRPRTVFDEGKITPDAIKKACENCQVTWPKGAN